MNKRHLTAYAVVAILFAATGAYTGLRQSAPPVTTAQPAGVTGPVAALFKETLPDAKGVATSLAQYKGKAMLVNFWATWCAPCVQEMPELSTLSAGEEGKKLQVIGIGIDSPSNITEFSDKYKITYPVLVAGMSGTDLSRQFGNTQGGLPFTVLIGADGQVKKTYLGKLKFDELRKDLATL
ncbi:redoxin family protein [Duganella sp. FT80W]|uniref:Redoxin family protein n=1 Tax=Duganella guangzhouensis TaxID=2666084 RepID=A0A6I2L913_9BURK|nr:TlpA disulfide reductase family protein [Duganella guangzhouensis]MRW92759.1 redoxin family protein [Duganella guangzhouensis]